MARETKVGLLAGLAFIICFAVILTNRGANGPPGITKPFLPEPASETQKVANRQTPARPASPGAVPAAATPRQNQVTDSTVVTRPEPPGTTLTSSASTPTTGAQVPLPPNTTPAMETGMQFAQQPRPQGIPVLSNEDLQRALASQSNPQTMLQPPPSNAAPVTITGSGANDPTRQSYSEDTLTRPAKQQPASPLQGIAYTVKASDTLSSIAAAHYGTKSRQAVQTIFDANRGVLTDMNHLKMGTVLTIPALGATAQPAAPAPVKLAVSEIRPPAHANLPPEKTEKKASDKKTNAKKPQVSEAKPASSPKNFRWYNVRKNDRYASIAREQLGDASRWRELFEMNKDKFPDPGMIREGVRIKLPATAMAAGKEKRN